MSAVTHKRARKDDTLTSEMLAGVVILTALVSMIFLMMGALIPLIQEAPAQGTSTSQPSEFKE